MREIALYIHIPFCLRKCAYCDFNSGEDLSRIPEYISALRQEIESRKFGGWTAKTIFMGGGTPTVLEANQLYSIIEALHLNFEIVSGAEFTVEANPGTLTREKLEILKSLGVNRISLGLQAYQDTILQALGRIHTVKDFEESYHLCREMGFDNINVDVMFGLPGQTNGDFETTIDKLLLLSPDHISCYSLIIEEGTRFHSLYRRGLLSLPSEDDERTMYHNAIGHLSRRGFTHYEISNFAKTGRESRHNLVYWNCEEYLGLGAGSHSYLQGDRFFNIVSAEAYAKAISQGLSPVAQRETISLRDRQSEYCFMRLRLTKGINKYEFYHRFGIDIKEVFGPSVEKLKDQELLEENPRNIKLTSKGLDFANDVFVGFLR